MSFACNNFVFVHRVRQVDKDHWDLQEYLVSRGHQEVQVQQEEEGHLATLECQGLRGERDLWVEMDHLETKENQAPQDHLVTEVQLEFLDQLDQLELEDRWEHKENVEILENLERRDLQAHQAYRALLGQLDQEEKEEKRDLWGNRVHPDFPEDMVIRAHLERLEVWDLPEDLDFQ